MQNDDPTVGRYEALSDAKMRPPCSWFDPEIDPSVFRSKWAKPAEQIDHLIKQKQEQEKKNNLEERINEANAKLESLRSLRAKLTDPECAKAVKAALELLR